MTVTLTVPGMWGSPKSVEPMLKGELTTPGQQLPDCLAGFGPVTNVVGVSYFNLLPSIFEPKDGRDKLDKAMCAVPEGEQIIVMTHSMGSHVAWLWHRDCAPTSTIDPNRVVFVTMGAAMSMKTLPYITGSRYRIIDVTRQWDRYADAPDLKRSKNYRVAVNNCARGDFILGPNLHSKGYLDIDLDRPDRCNTIGSATYLFYNTAKVPLPGGKRDVIESAYKREYLG